jgi:GTP cyclohydrolase II
VRIQSRCLYGETLGAVDCECAEQLRESLRRIQESGSGILVYLDQEGRGAGLSIKAWSYELAERFDLDTFGAYKKAGVAHDQRSYVDVVRVLELLEVRTCRLLTNNPAKIEALENAGIDVRRESLWVRDDPRSATTWMPNGARGISTEGYPLDVGRPSRSNHPLGQA